MTLEDFQNKGWVYIDEIDSLPDVRSFHCDTRDFHVSANDESESLDPNDHAAPWTGAYLKLINSSKCKEDFLIEKDEIIPLLKRLETWSGGKADWRRLSFDEQLPDKTGWDYKYLRFYKWKAESTKYIVCTSYGTAIHWRDMRETNIDKEHLCTH